RLQAGLAVSDSAVAVAAVLDGLQGLAAVGKLASIAMSDPTTPTLTITALQLAADAAALGKIVISFNIAATGTLGAIAAARVLATPLIVADSAAAGQANLGGLQILAGAGHLGSITLTNAAIPVLTVTASQLAADAGALGDIVSTYAVSASGLSASFNGDSVRN